MALHDFPMFSSKAGKEVDGMPPKLCAGVDAGRLLQRFRIETTASRVRGSQTGLRRSLISTHGSDTPARVNGTVLLYTISSARLRTALHNFAPVSDQKDKGRATHFQSRGNILSVIYFKSISYILYN